jgi:hypothetical protein
MSNTEFELGMKHVEFLGEIIVGLLVVSGGGSGIVGVVKTYKRINVSPVQLFNDTVDASFDVF